MSKAKKSEAFKRGAERLFNLIESAEAALPAHERQVRWERFMNATDAVAQRHGKQRPPRQKQASRAASPGQ